MTSVMPSGWKESELSELGKCIRGVSYNPEVDLRERDSADSVRLLRSNNVQDGTLDLTSLQFVSKVRVSPQQNMSSGDILICMANGSKQLVGKAARFEIRREHPYTFGAFMGIFRPFDKTDSDFIYFVMQSKAYRTYLDIALSGSSINNLRPSNILEMVFVIPEQDERKRISNALVDLDLLVRELDKLIAKKREIKQGAMQQLLTGKTRLPGFSGEWKEVTLGDIGNFRGGTGFPLRFQGKTLGELPFYKVSDMNNPGNEIYMRKANNYIERSRLQSLGAKSFSKGSIVFAKVGAAVFLERKRLLSADSCLDNNMAGFTLQAPDIDQAFIYHWFQQFRLSDLVAATALPSINNQQLRKISCQLPTLIREQQVIAEILSDMDAEIDALIARRDKTALIKTGMMQELLTGRTRLL